MNFLGISGKFKDQSNYLVAFLAAVIGLGVFKDDLSVVTINVFNREPSVFNVAVLMVILLFCSTYFSALALMIDNFNFTKFPLKGWMTFFASYIGALGLLIPIIFIVFWGLSELSMLITNHKDILSIFALLSKIALPILSLAAAFFIVRNMQRRDTKQEALQIVTDDRNRLNEELKANILTTSKKVSEYDFLQKYETTLNFIKDYLDVMGYSAKNASLGQMAKTLLDNNIFSKNDFVNAKTLQDLRNSYAHGAKDRLPSRAANAVKQLEAMHEKVEQAFWNLIADQDDLGGKSESSIG